MSSKTPRTDAVRAIPDDGLREHRLWLLAQKLEEELGMETERVRRLEAEAEASAWQISPAMAQATIDQQAGRIKRLEEAVKLALATSVAGPMPKHVETALREAKEARP